MYKQTIPSEAEIIEFVTSQGGFVLRRDIARAFHLKGGDRRDLKAVLKELESKGQLERRGKSYKSKIPSDLVVVRFLGEGTEGELLACPIHEAEENYFETIILNVESFKKASQLVLGDKLVVKITRLKDGVYSGQVIRKISVEAKTIVGVVTHVHDHQYIIRPIDRRDRNFYPADLHLLANIQDGDLVEAELINDKSSQTQKAVVQEVLQTKDQVQKQLSLIAVHNYDLPYKFSDEALSEAKRCRLPSLDGRIDLRHLPLVTIDDEDARDHDDAVWAAPDSRLKNPGGWHIIVAIADVSYFVEPYKFLDREALARSNSVYFPDQVLPMLPEQLSNDLCSLKPEVDRPCLAVHLYINAQGILTEFEFFRGMMRSQAKLTYQGVQASIEKQPNKIPKELQSTLIPHLYGAYKTLKRAREQRGTLELNIPEMKITLTADGNIQRITPRHRFESHQLIEEMMILANVAAAQFLDNKKVPTLYRIHEEPSPEKVEELRLFLKSTPFSLPKGQVIRPKNFNHILNGVADTPAAPAINELILRAQAQAAYSPDNLGHFGLNLARYCHFTSPIRRYADLLVHRGILSILEADKNKYPYTFETLEGIGEEVSEKERRAAKAERETIERYVARFLESRVGDILPAKISGITEFAVFLTLEEVGASGMLPLRNLAGDYYHYDPVRHTLTGRRSKHKLTLGDRLDVCLENTNALTGSLIFSAVSAHSLKRKKLKRSFGKNRKVTKN